MLAPIPVNVSAIYKGKAPDSMYLVPGDQIVVPGNKLKKWKEFLGFTPMLSFARSLAPRFRNRLQRRGGTQWAAPYI